MTDFASRLSLEQVKSLMRANGVRQLHAKILQANDNSKNQIYFGGDFGALNMLPTDRPEAADKFERPSARPLRAGLSFSWLEPSGDLRSAPNAKLILYPQYPEVRFSGYLSGVRERQRLSALVGASREPGRVLLLGTCDDGRIVGFVDAADSPLAAEVRQLRQPEQIGVFVSIPLGLPSGVSARAQLLDELARIEALGWIDSKRLRADGTVLPHLGQNGGGYTLEAELKVRPNGRAEPDFLGWEVKQHGETNFELLGNRAITLMTPEPTGGLYQEQGVKAFVERYGYADRRGRDARRNFGGVHCCGDRHDLTGLQLELTGFDKQTGKITDVSGGIALIDDHDEVAAIWHFADLMVHWSRKHASAVYVPSMSRTEPGKQYRYSARVRLGIGTSIDRLLQAIAAKKVYYDPAIKVVRVGDRTAVKRRSQFRIKSHELAALYERFETTRGG